MSKKLTYAFVKESFEQENCVTKFTEYINNNTKLDYICPNNHKHSITWNKWKQGKRCPHCAGVTKPLIGSINQEFDEAGYILLTTVYINNRQKLDFICPSEHEHSITWGSWSLGQRCGRCNGNIEVKYKNIVRSFETEGYILTSKEYINNQTLLNTRCSNNHEYKITWSNWKAGKRCPKCSNNGTSKFEKEVKQIILDQGQEIIENDRTTIMGNKGYFLELDILLPCKTKAIECNGVYWHSKPDVIKNDDIKNKQCKKLGINLLTITDKEWYNNRKECEDKIKKFLID